MGDAFKCKNCGTVVETPQRCPSCDETAMRPVQSPADSDAVSDDDESLTTAADDESPAATESDDSSKTGPETDPGSSDDQDTASGQRRESRSESGLLSWLKSLF